MLDVKYNRNPQQLTVGFSSCPLYVNFESTNVTMNHGNRQSKEGESYVVVFIFLYIFNQNIEM